MAVSRLLTILGLALLFAVSGKVCLAVEDKAGDHKPGQEKVKGKKNGKDAHAPDGKKPHKHDEKAKESPIFPWALDLGLWTLVVFLGLLLILTKFAWKPMLEGLRKREENIRSAAEEAKNLRQEMADERVKFEAQLAKAHAEIPKMMEEARKDADNLREEMRNTASKEIQDERMRLRREVETAKDQALHEIYTQSAILATLISSKAIGKSDALSEDFHRQLIDEALSEMKEGGEKWKAGSR